jgi:hypothetical protein
MGILLNLFSLRIKVKLCSKEERRYVISLSRDAQIHLDRDMLRHKCFPEIKSTVTAVVLMLAVTHSMCS